MCAARAGGPRRGSADGAAQDPQCLLDPARSAAGIAARASVSRADSRSVMSVRNATPRSVTTRSTSRRSPCRTRRWSRPAASSRSHSRLAVGSPTRRLSARAVRFSSGRRRTARSASICLGDSRGVTSSTAENHSGTRFSTASRSCRSMSRGPVMRGAYPKRPGVLCRPRKRPLPRIAARRSGVATPCGPLPRRRRWAAGPCPAPDATTGRTRCRAPAAPGPRSTRAAAGGCAARRGRHRCRRNRPGRA